MTQDPKGGLRGPTVVPEGGVVVIEVMNGATSVEVSQAGDSKTTSYPVGPDGRARVPVIWSGGTVLCISTGQWPNFRVMLVEVIATIR